MMEDLLKKNVGYLISLYKKAGFPAKDLYAELQIDPSTYHRWKTKQYMPDSYNQQRIAEMFDLSAKQLTELDLESMADPPGKIKLFRVYAWIESASKEQIETVYEYFRGRDI